MLLQQGGKEVCMTDWLSDAIDSTPDDGEATQPRPSLRPVSEPAADDWLTEEPKRAETVAPEQGATGHQPRLNAQAQKRFFLGVFAVIIVGLGACTAFVVKNLTPSDDQPAQAQEAAVTQPATSSQPAQPTATQPPKDAAQQKFAGTCAGKTPAVKPGQDSLNATVAAFQKAYFDKNAKKITSLVSPDSALKKQNWKKVLSGIESGSQWCVKLEPGKKDNSVNADLTVTAQGKKTVYQQTVTGTKNKGAWLIKSIDKRADAGKAQ